MLKSLYTRTPFAPYLTLAFLTIISTLLLWLPFQLKFKSINGIATPDLSFETVLKHWDGPLYIIPAKTWYNTKDPIVLGSPLGLPPTYFAAHLPGYPATIAALAPLLGFPKASVISTLIAATLLTCFFYFFVSRLKLSKNPLLLSMIFLVITPRMFVVRSIGAPEPLFMLCILASLYFFVQKKHFFTALFAAFALITKTPALLLFIAYMIFFIIEYIQKKEVEFTWRWIMLIPLALFGVFMLYAKQMGDFYAYFNSGDNLHLMFPPFSAFNFQKDWVGTAWLEDIVFIYFFYGLTLFMLWEKMKDKFKDEKLERFYKISFYFVLLFFASIISIQHRDISRYSLPMLPFALIAFEKFFTSRAFMTVLVLLLPAIYLYAVNFMLFNIAPVTDWIPFL